MRVCVGGAADVWQPARVDDAGQALGFLTRSDSAAELNFTRTLVRLKEKYQAFLTTVRQLASWLN